MNMMRIMKKQQESSPYNKNDVKSHLALETFNIYQNSHFSCIHNNHHSFNNLPIIQSPFIDWYLILRVGEDASTSTIRKQYHKLALLLHPDKNKHPKAEFAFKLISQAYKCLSDDAKRISFNLEKWRNQQCTECSRIPHNSIHSTHNANNYPKNSTRNSKSSKLQQHFRAIKERFIEEAKVIEGCMRANQAPKNEYPVFEPANYTHQGYPHRRNHNTMFYKTCSSFWNVQKRNLFDQRGRCESPVFELKSKCTKINSTCVGS